jgi:hypothetical protein
MRMGNAVNFLFLGVLVNFLLITVSLVINIIRLERKGGKELVTKFVKDFNTFWREYFR